MNRRPRSMPRFESAWLQFSLLWLRKLLIGSWGFMWQNHKWHPTMRITYSEWCLFCKIPASFSQDHVVTWVCITTVFAWVLAIAHKRHCRHPEAWTKMNNPGMALVLWTDNSPLGLADEVCHSVINELFYWLTYPVLCLINNSTWKCQ